jgi:hypothetical protein
MFWATTWDLMLLPYLHIVRKDRARQSLYPGLWGREKETLDATPKISA